MILTFFMCTDHDHSSHGIEGQGQRSRLGLWLVSLFETRPVGRRSSIEDSFLVTFRFASAVQIY